MKLNVGFIFMLLFVYGSTFSQRASVTQGIEWFGTSSAVKLAPKFGIYLDGQYRFATAFESMQHQFRSAFDIYVNDKLTISPVGYVFIWNYIYGEQPASVINNEHRIFQQLQYRHSAGKFHFTHRFRTEQRLIQFHSGTPPNIIDEGYDENFQFRIRHRVWVNMPFKGEKVEPKSWYLAGLVEGFMSWGERVNYGSIIDQYRLFLGLGYQFSKNGNIQVGPFYQYLLKSTGDKYENNVGAYLQLNYNFDFSKRSEN